MEDRRPRYDDPVSPTGPSSDALRNAVATIEGIDAGLGARGRTVEKLARQKAERFKRIAFRLRLPEVYGARRGEHGWSAAVSLREMQRLLASALEKGLIRPADAKEERKVLMEAARYAMENGRAPIHFPPAEAIALRRPSDLAAKKKRKAEKEARRRQRPRKKGKRR